ncbi:MAG: sulfatase-like hydrolase/transferase [bacterium]|nr:sulfatase-like hydrolase/transferase [bacterium]
MKNALKNRPNIIVILTDDQGYWAMGCAGNREIKTPNLDRLAASGMRFENFFCASPVCSPARASLLTGRIPSSHGVHDWIRYGNTHYEEYRGGRPIEYLKGMTGYTDILARNGYLCGLSGKWHLGDSERPQKGFNYWQVHSTGGGPYYGAPMIYDGKLVHEERYVTDAITDNALAFLKARAHEHGRPFYLSVHYTAPHSPWDADQHPAEIYNDYYANCPFDSVPRQAMHPRQINSAPCGDTEENRRAVLSGYFAAVTAFDANLGRILDKVEAMGIRERTLIFFTSDNGMNMGHHGIYGKGNGTFPMNMFDTSVKVPAIISRPGSVPEGTVRDEMLSHYDFMPTLLDYVGLENPETERLPGRSFAALLRGEAPAEPDVAGERVVVYDEYGPVRMIRDRRWKYVHRYPYGPHELYDLEADLDEASNLIDDPAHEARLVELRAGLEDWFARYVDPLKDGAREAVTGKGQSTLAGPAARGLKNYEDDWFYVKTGTKKAE